jgi:hypothetical protein
MGKIHGKPRLYLCHINLTNWPFITKLHIFVIKVIFKKKCKLHLIVFFSKVNLYINLICCKFMNPKPIDKFGKTLFNLV